MIGSTGGSDGLYIEAAEYVIGTLGPEERTAFAQRLREDAEAGRAVADWERRLAGLALLGDAARPSSEVWTRIEQDLRTLRSKPLPFRVIEGGHRPDRRLDSVPEYRRSRDRWRAAALFGGAVAAALVGFIVARETNVWPATEPQTTYIAAVNRGGDKPALIVRVDLKTHHVLVHPVAAETPAGRSLELWYVGDGTPPRSMGIVQATSAVMAMPQGADRPLNSTFAVSVEPTGGSTTGAPTGPVVYSGQLVAD